MHTQSRLPAVPGGPDHGSRGRSPWMDQLTDLIQTASPASPSPQFPHWTTENCAQVLIQIYLWINKQCMFSVLPNKVPQTERVKAMPIYHLSVLYGRSPGTAWLLYLLRVSHITTPSPLLSSCRLLATFRLLSASCHRAPALSKTNTKKLPCIKYLSCFKSPDISVSDCRSQM